MSVVTRASRYTDTLGCACRLFLPMSCLLALDASTETIHLALVLGSEVLVRAVPGGAKSSALLLPEIQALLADAGRSVRDLDGVAYGRGPGAFTGLRTACSVAQGLALGVGCPVYALDTLAAVAESAHHSGAPDRIWTMIDARMDEIYAACWRKEAAGQWEEEVPVGLYGPAALVESLRVRPAALAGNALGVHPCLMVQGAAGTWPLAAPDGVALAHLARHARASNLGLDPALALPLYVRDKVAQTTAERAEVKRLREQQGAPAAEGVAP